MVEERAHGGYQVVASTLTQIFDYAVTRQQVYIWWRRRSKNGFPDEAAVTDPKGRQFFLDDVVEWYRVNYPESRRERLACQNQEKQARRMTKTLGGSANT